MELKKRKLKTTFDFVSVEIAQSHDIEVGKKEDERMMIIALSEKID